MTKGKQGGWQWSNVPVPEPHVVGLVVGATIHARRPMRLFEDGRRSRRVGWGLIGVGSLVIGWAVRAMDEVDSAKPMTLVTIGPYAFSRNPMYVAWTALYLGVTLVMNTAWLLVVFPGVALATHWSIRREERALERRFADEYRAYIRSVRRYL